MSDAVETNSALDGPTLYATYCALCHGDDGEGYQADAANALANADFLAIATDEFLRTGIERGRPGTPMSAWKDTWGGPLSKADISRLVYHIRGWQKNPSIDISDIGVEGEVERGELIYDVHCKNCHGKDGGGGSHMSLSNAEFLASASDGYLRHSIENGRTGTVMPAYALTFTPQQIDDLVVLIRSWQRPTINLSTQAPEIDPDTLLLNPDGPEPVFEEGRFISVAELKAAIDANAALVIIDARPSSDYLQGHIAGAISIPFYAVETSLDFLPLDQWIVTYCACPHAESEAAADVLEANDYTLVKVLNEGFLYWQEKGYPIHVGANP